MREMRSGRGSEDMDSGQQPLVAVAIDKDKGSQTALKWTVDNLVAKGQTVILVHVKHRVSISMHPNNIDDYVRDLFLPFRCFCMRKDIQCKDITLEGIDVAKSIIEFVSQNAIEKLVVGAPSRSTFIRRFKAGDVPTSVSKGAPDFCSVFVISKGKISSVRKAVRQAPASSSLRSQLNIQPTIRPELISPPIPTKVNGEASGRFSIEKEMIISPFARGARGMSTRPYPDITMPETDISFVSSGRPSTDRLFPSLYDEFDGYKAPRLSNGSDRSYGLMSTPRKSMETDLMGSQYSSFSQESGTSSWSSQAMDEVEMEMRRLRLELKQTMEMYNTACKEALTAKQKAGDFHRWKIEEEQKLQDARSAQEAALAMVEREKAKCKAAMEAAEAAKRIAELEAQKRLNAEMKAFKESEEKKLAFNSLAQTNARYRKYTIDEIEAATDFFSMNRKIGEGGYGPVFKCYLDHTPVAVKVLRPDAAQGRSQFQQEVEVLSCIRHPNMVLLLGACPEYGCLVYEYMANGSLEDRLFQRGNTPVIPWQLRFRIAAEVATGLLFLHQTKPEPLVHRDLKPGNILLDRNYVSKISDVGLARLVPPSIANNVTQYRLTSTAGTFCYIDPEYQQTGMLGIKSDIYSFGIMLLQIVTGKPPMGLTHYVSDAIENGEFEKMLDPAVPDWPLEEALKFAKLSLQCAELRRKDRPDLGTVVLPELNKLRELADENMYHGIMGGSGNPSPIHSQISISQEGLSDRSFTQSESESRVSVSSFPGQTTS